MVQMSTVSCTGPGRSTLDQFSYPVPNGFTFESDPVWNCAVPGLHRDRANSTRFRRTEPEWIRSKWSGTAPISCKHSLKATFHLTISMSGQSATGKIQMNNYHHGSCAPSLTGKTMSVFLIFTQGTHRNVKNRWVRSSLYSLHFGTLQADSLELLFGATHDVLLMLFGYMLRSSETHSNSSKRTWLMHVACFHGQHFLCLESI